MNDRSLHAVLDDLIPELRYFDEIDSTNQFALEWAEAGAPDGALVVADLQTAGRGRLGRRWITRPGVSLAFSLVFHPVDAEKPMLPLFSALAGVGLAKALEQDFNLSPLIKWPNDVILEEKKTAGILVEASWLGENLQSAIMGIGVNVAPQSVPPAEELLFPAISIEEVLGRMVDREYLLRAILQRILEWRPLLGKAEFMQVWENGLAFRGRRVAVQQPGLPSIEGKLLGVSAQGNLRLQTDTGVISVVAGDVSLRPLG